MPKITESDFKKAFNKKSTKFADGLDELEDKIAKVTSAGGTVERFQKAFDDLDNQFKELSNGNGSYKDAYKKLKDINKVLEVHLKGIQAQAEFAKVKIQPEGLKEIKFYTGSIPGFADLSKEKQAQVQKEIVGKIANGKAKFDEMSKKDFDPAKGPGPTDEDLADFMWYVKAMAENKTNEPSAKGAVTMPDPGNKIRKYLSRAPGMYYRQSSHLREQAEEASSNTDGTKTPRGFDFYEGSADDTSKLLPYGMNAVLLQSVETTAGAQLYMKMETESARLSPEAKVKGNEMAEKRRDWKKEDVGRTIKHGANLFFPEKDKTGLSAFRENTPVEDIDAYDQLMKQMELMNSPKAMKTLSQGYEAPPENNQVMKVLKGEEEKKEKAVAKGNRMRIFQMLKNMDDCLSDPDLDELARLQIAAQRKALGEKYSDGQARFGGEIVLSDTDLHAKDDGKPTEKKEPTVALEDGEPQERTKKSKKSKSKDEKYVELEDDL